MGWRRGTASSSLRGGGGWELVLWRGPDAACGFGDGGLPCQRDGIASATASSPGRARGEGKSHQGGDGAVGEARGRSQPRTVMAGSGGLAEGPKGWDGGVKGGERGANKSCIE